MIDNSTIDERTYENLASLDNKALAVKMDKLSAEELLLLIRVAYKRYIHYNEEADKYCPNYNKELFEKHYEKLGEKAPLIFEKTETISVEQFQKVVSKLSKSEHIIQLSLGMISYIRAMDDLDVDFANFYKLSTPSTAKKPLTPKQKERKRREAKIGSVTHLTPATGQPVNPLDDYSDNPVLKETTTSGTENLILETNYASIEEELNAIEKSVIEEENRHRNRIKSLDD